MTEHMNGGGGIPQPTPTPVPNASRSLNGDVPQLIQAERSSPSKSVRWNGTDRDIIEIQKTSMAIGLPSSNTQLSGGFTHSNHNDVNGVKFISLAAPIQNDVRGLCTASRDMRMDSSKSMVLQSLPFRATLHKHKQIPGRFFPSPSYTEFQRDVLESRPTPRRVIKKFKPNNHTTSASQLFPAGSPVKPRTASDKSTWVANHVYSRGSQGAGDPDRGPLLPPDIDMTISSARQYSIPATTKFHDGNNDTLITGLSKRLHAKDLMPDAPPTSRILTKTKQMT